MKIKLIKKKRYMLFVVLIIILISIPSISGIYVDKFEKDFLNKNKANEKIGFITGPYESKSWDEDHIVLLASWQSSPARELNFFVPFRRDHLHRYEQIRLTKFDNCIFIKNFVIGFCKIYMPESEISMSIKSQNDSENEVFWQIDEIIGDKVWENNIDVELYNESGSRYRKGFQFGPLGPEYLSIGDQIRIKTIVDGYYSIKFVESISKDVLFESPYIKY